MDHNNLLFKCVHAPAWPNCEPSWFRQCPTKWGDFCLREDISSCLYQYPQSQNHFQLEMRDRQRLPEFSHYGCLESPTWNSISLPGLSRGQNATQRNRMAKFKHPEPKWSSQFVRTRTRGSWPRPSRSPHCTIRLSEGSTQKASARAYLSVRLLCLFVPSVARWIAEGWCLLCNRWPGTALNTLPELGLLLWS